MPPIIADHLKRGLAIECWCWNEDHEAKRSKDFVVYYDFGETFKYGIFDDAWMNAEPIEIKTVFRKKMASEIMKWLEDRGYEFDGEVWVSKGVVGQQQKQTYGSTIFMNCGKIMAFIFWGPSDWYEEVEV